MIKGSYSTTLHLLAVCPQPGQGVISTGADGKPKLFLQQPLGDIDAGSIDLVFNSRYLLLAFVRFHINLFFY